MSEQYKHGSCVFPTAAFAMEAFFEDYFTACGHNSSQEALDYMKDVDEDDVESIRNSVEGWKIPAYADEYDIKTGFAKAKELLEKSI